MAEETEHKYRIRRRDKFPSYPELMKKVETVAVDYNSTESGPGVAYVRLDQIEGADADAIWKQIVAGDGKLYNQYMKLEKAAVEADIEHRLEGIPKEQRE